MEELFDKSAEYDEMLNRGISLSGEDKFFFIHGRFADLANNIPSGKKINAILDFGCGVGDATILLKKYFPNSTITGNDTAAEALKYAPRVSRHTPQGRLEARCGWASLRNNACTTTQKNSDRHKQRAHSVYLPTLVQA